MDSIADRFLRSRSNRTSMNRLYSFVLNSSKFAFRRSISSGSPIPVRDIRNLLQTHVASLSEARRLQPSELERLEPRRPSDSHDTAVLPLANDELLREKYQNFLGHVRFGMLLEDLDTFAVWLAYRHNQIGTRMGREPNHHPMAIVTACVDRIALAHRRISTERDIIFDGEISWAGRSSLEATIRLLQERTGGGSGNAKETNKDTNLLLEAKFVMVAKDPETQKPVTIHPLKPETPQEQELYDQGEESKNQRLKQKKESLMKTPPTAHETALLHELFVQTLDPKIHSFRHRRLPDNHVWMEDCKLKNVIICFPQQRNLYNKIFGGFLMRTAFELAWANAASFSNSHPITVAVDDIMFRESVDVGRLLYLSSDMCFTKNDQMQVRVNAEVVNIEEGTQYTTNTFYFTFLSGNRKPVQRVMPRSYGDGMLYLAGTRHFNMLTSGAK